MDDVPPVNNEVNLDDDDLGVSEINLDDDDDIFKSARLEPEPAKMMQEPEVVRSNGGANGINEGVTSSGGGLTNGHHKDQGVRAESEEPVETDIPLEVIIYPVVITGRQMTFIIRMTMTVRLITPTLSRVCSFSQNQPPSQSRRH